MKNGTQKQYHQLLDREIKKIDGLIKEVILSDGIRLNMKMYLWLELKAYSSHQCIDKSDVVAIRRVADTDKIREFFQRRNMLLVIGGGVLA